MVTFVGVVSDTNDDVSVPVSDITVTNTTELMVRVPVDAVSGPIEVEVNVETTTSDIFTVTDGTEPPTPPSLSITSIDPTEGAVGEEVTIMGQNFGATAAENMVTFVGVESDTNDDVPVLVSDITVTNTTELMVRVPDGAISGPIEVEVDGETATSDIFTVTDGTTPLSLAISKIDPESGAVGDPIEIIGTGFSVTAAENEVSFDGGTNYVMAASIKAEVSADADTLTVNVPSDAVTGTIWVKVNDGTPVESANDFTVLAAD